MQDSKEVVRDALSELRNLKEQAPFEPTADIDMVWVLSAPGTAKSVSNAGIYKGRSADRERIDAGALMVKKITALRMGKGIDNVTKEDIEEQGPDLYYNGEDKSTKNYNYTQNEDLVELAGESDFMIPISKIKIGHIPEIGTPAQVIQFAEFLQSRRDIKKVAVLSHISHSRRVSRYLAHYRELFPTTVILLDAVIPETENKVGTVLSEMKKVKRYYEKGDLDKDPYFKDEVIE